MRDLGRCIRTAAQELPLNSEYTISPSIFSVDSIVTLLRNLGDLNFYRAGHRMGKQELNLVTFKLGASACTLK